MAWVFCEVRTVVLYKSWMSVSPEGVKVGIVVRQMGKTFSCRM